MNRKLTCASFFAGVGGIDLGFQKAGMETIYMQDWDRACLQTLRRNFTCRMEMQDIRNLDWRFLPPFDILLAGFPCQPFSIAGNRKGFQDPRGSVFFSLVRLIEKIQPPILFLENVKHLLHHHQGATFQEIQKTLEELGYETHFQVLNALEYGNLPQNRERLYMVSFLDHAQYQKFHFPPKIPLTQTIKDILVLDQKVEDKYYYTSQSKIYPFLQEEVTQEGKIYQWRRSYVRMNPKGVCPTLTANMGMGGHNVPIIRTPRWNSKIDPKRMFPITGIPKILLPTRILE